MFISGRSCDGPSNDVASIRYLSLHCVQNTADLHPPQPDCQDIRVWRSLRTSVRYRTGSITPSSEETVEICSTWEHIPVLLTSVADTDSLNSDPDPAF